jgi:hypothetical protein
MVLSDFFPISACRMVQEKRAVAPPLLSFNVRPRLDLQNPLDGFGVFTGCGFGIARKSMAPDLKVEAVGFLVAALVDGHGVSVTF